MSQTYQSQILDHLGPVAGMFDELGIAAVMAKATQQDPARRMVTAGHAVKPMVLNGLGFVKTSEGVLRTTRCGPVTSMAMSWPLS